MKLIKLAGLVASGLNVRDIARSVMMHIAAHTGETISINTAIGKDRVCIDVVESTSRLMHIVNLGEHAPLIYGATGKVLLAHLPENERKEVLAALPPDYPLSVQELEAELAEIREKRYTITRSERVVGSLAISVAIFDINDFGKYAVTLTGPEERMKPHQEEYLEMMLQAQSEISTKMGSGLFPNR